MQKLLSTRQVSELTGMHPDTVRKMCARKEIRSVRRKTAGKNAHYRIPSSEVERIINHGF